MARTIIKNAQRLYTFNAQKDVLHDADLLIEGGTIVSVGSDVVPAESDRVIDASEHLVLPGLINTHHHFFQNVTRAVPTTFQSTILDWLKDSYLLWAGLDPEIVYWGTQLAAAELLLSGCTTTADFAYLYPQGQASLFDEEVRAVEEMGIRFHGVRGCTPVLEEPVADALRALGVDAGQFVEDEAAIFAACASAVERHHDPAYGAMVRVAVGPTQTHYRSPDFMSGLKQFARERGVRTHVHFHPRPDERALTQRLYGITPHEFLDRNGWLDEETWLAHASEHQPEEIELLARRGTGMSHCPGCIMRLGMTVTKVPQMASAGVAVSIGVDGGSSNDSGSMLPELRNALMIHRLKGIHPEIEPGGWLGPEDVFEMATVGGAKVLGRSDIGALEAGLMADVVLIKTSTIRLAGSFDPLGSLLFTAAPGVVDYTIVNGEVLVADGRLTSGRERQIVDNANRAAKVLAERARSSFGVDLGYGW
jgi:8-oxoguanine deaminase